MTTATAHPPTEEEIRAMLAAMHAAYPHDSGEKALTDAVEEMFGLIDYRPLSEEEAFDWGDETPMGDDVWADLRPTEWKALAALVATGRERAYARALEAIIEEIVAAALAFAAEHPDAPRARPAA